MEQNGINSHNGGQELNRRTRNPDYQVVFLDVYIMLFSFIKSHRKDNIFDDEFTIHHSMYSKLNVVWILRKFISIEKHLSIGGYGSESRNALEKYEMHTNVWTKHSISFDVYRHCLTKISHDRLIIIGGKQSRSVSEEMR